MSSSVHGGNIYKFAAEKKIEPLEVIDFSANINPLGMSPRGVMAMRENFSQCCHYPDPNNEELIAKISDIYKIDGEQILPGNGAAELLFALCRLKNLGQVFLPSPGFSEYFDAAQAANLPIYPFEMLNQPTGTFSIDYDALLDSLKAFKHSTSLVFLGNPNNPDGSLLELDKFLPFLEKAAVMDAIVMVDESFIDFTDGSTSLRPYVKMYPNLFILHSLTKYLAVPGLRMGVLYTPKKFREELHSYIPTWSVNRLAQVYAVEALGDVNYLKTSTEYVQKEKDYVFNRLSQLSYLKPYNPSVNFILIKWLAEEGLLEQLIIFLAQQNIIIRSCSSYPALGKKWFRIAVKERHLNDLLINLIEEFAHEHNLSG